MVPAHGGDVASSAYKIPPQGNKPSAIIKTPVSRPGARQPPFSSLLLSPSPNTLVSLTRHSTALTFRNRRAHLLPHFPFPGISLHTNRCSYRGFRDPRATLLSQRKRISPPPSQRISTVTCCLPPVTREIISLPATYCWLTTN
jgi:hypothetical protein